MSSTTDQTLTRSALPEWRISLIAETTANLPLRLRSDSAKDRYRPAFVSIADSRSLYTASPFCGSIGKSLRVL